MQAGVPYSNPKGMREPQLLQVLAAVVSYYSYEDCRAKFVHAVLSTDSVRHFSSPEAQHKAGAALEMYIKACKGGSAGPLVCMCKTCILFSLTWVPPSVLYECVAN